MRFRKKPVEIEAMQYDGLNAMQVVGWIGWDDAFIDRAGNPVITTLEGHMTTSPGDWVIRGVQGEFYPCKPDIFEATYEPVTTTAPDGSTVYEE